MSDNGRMDEEDDINMDIMVSDEEGEFDDDEDDDVDEDDDEVDDMTDDAYTSSGVGGVGTGTNNMRQQQPPQQLPAATSAGQSSSSEVGQAPAQQQQRTRPTAQQNQQQMEPSGEEASAIARRRTIQQIMADKTLTEQEKRMRIQQLMSQNRLVVAPAPSPVLPSHNNQAGGDGTNSNNTTANAACVHYERNCNIVSPCCNRIFGCRICHDELSQPGHPPMNRYEIREIICKNCQTRQSSKTNQCISCQTVFGEYYCNICNLWMSKVCRL
jgi:uncharacterized CHY-type Zn-finger protein